MRRRVLGLTAAAILLWSAQDAVIWRGWFDGRPWSPSADLYQFWHQAFLVGLLLIGMALIGGRWAWWFAAATWTLANSGLPDILYYWLDLKRIPANLPWLDQTHPLIFFHPATAETVLASSIIWVGVWIASLWVAPVAKRLLVVAGLHDRDVVAERGHNCGCQHDARPQSTL